MVPYDAASLSDTLSLRKLDFHFLSNWMGYDRGDSFPFDFEPNEIQFGLKLKGKLSPRSSPIQFERKRKYSFLSVSETCLWCYWKTRRLFAKVFSIAEHCPGNILLYGLTTPFRFWLNYGAWDFYSGTVSYYDENFFKDFYWPKKSAKVLEKFVILLNYVDMDKLCRYGYIRVPSAVCETGLMMIIIW